MKNPGSFLVVIEFFIVLLMSLVSGYTLFGVSINSVIAFGALLLLGIITIIIFPLSSLFFSAGALLMIIPALMKLNSVKWWAFSEESLVFCPTLGFQLALIIGLALVSGSLLLSHIHSLRREVRTIRKIEAVPSRGYVLSQSLCVGVAILVCTVFALVASLVIGVARGSLTNWLDQLPLWTLSVVSLAAFVIIALILFWISSTRRISR